MDEPRQLFRTEHTTTIPLTVRNLPQHLLFEEDGCAWRAVLDQFSSTGWRWSARNMNALIKGEPAGEMHDHPPINWPGK